MRLIRLTLLYALATILFTWPLTRNLHVVDGGDSAFFAWEMGWELHALTTAPSQLPHANIFHPLRYVLGMDEPILGTTILVLPFRLVTSDAIVLYNLARLLTFVLSALGAYFLARELGCSEGAAILGGALFAFSPIRTDQIAHLSTLGTQWLPPMLLFLIRFARAGRLVHAAAAAVFFVLATYACGYHGVLGIAILAIAGIPLFFGRPDRWRGVLLGLSIAAIGVLPLYLLHRAALAPLEFGRGVAETRMYSASLETFLAASTWNQVYGGITASLRILGSNNLFPGLAPIVLAAAGFLALRRLGRRPSREAWALGLMAVSAAVLALGPDVRLFDRTLFPGPFGWLRDHVGVYSQIRVPGRSGAFIALGLSMLGALGFTTVALRGVVAALVAVMAMAETVIAPIPSPGWMQVADSRVPPDPVYAWLAGQPDGVALVELPMLDAASLYARPQFHESAYMVRSLHHWKRLVNGYSGVAPPSYLALRDAARAFPSGNSAAALRAAGVRFVIVHRAGLRRGERKRMDAELPVAPGVRPVQTFGSDVVYEIESTVPKP